ncbi:MAG TPA: nucleotidyltransferase [Ruminococcus sp.]|nr:nucleotidyltransferase [Ruminococcus sp.]
MKVSGIIAEYNPFHNGHLYHVNETRRHGATHIVAVMSGSFVQRGDAAIMDKFRRARLAVRSGVDLVIELPVQYSLSSAESFASGAVWLLNCLGAVDELSFGSECGSVEKLTKALDMVQRTADVKAEEIRRIMEKGYTYPRALTSVVRGESPELADIISEPNNTLGIEYMKALRAFSSSVTPYTVKRRGDSHDGSSPDSGFASASYIREKLLSETEVIHPEDYMPEHVAKAIRTAEEKGELADLRRLERVFLYKLRTTSAEELSMLCDVGQGLENRLYSARTASSLEELLYSVKTKRYTMARLKRILISLLIGITREDMKHLPPYGRILAFNDRGTEILARAKDHAVIPYGTSVSRLAAKNSIAKRFAQLEERASDIYGLALGKAASAQDDLRAKITIDME